MAKTNNLSNWMKDTGVRTVKTMAETALALIGTNAIGITAVDWLGVGSACLLAGVVTILTCIVSFPYKNKIKNEDE